MIKDDIHDYVRYLNIRKGLVEDLMALINQYKLPLQLNTPYINPANAHFVAELVSRLMACAPLFSAQSYLDDRFHDRFNAGRQYKGKNKGKEKEQSSLESTYSFSYSLQGAYDSIVSIQPASDLVILRVNPSSCWPLREPSMSLNFGDWMTFQHVGQRLFQRANKDDMLTVGVEHLQQLLGFDNNCGLDYVFTRACLDPDVFFAHDFGIPIFDHLGIGRCNQALWQTNWTTNSMGLTLARNN